MPSGAMEPPGLAGQGSAPDEAETETVTMAARNVAKKAEEVSRRLPAALRGAMLASEGNPRMVTNRRS